MERANRRGHFWPDRQVLRWAGCGRDRRADCWSYYRAGKLAISPTKGDAKGSQSGNTRVGEGGSSSAVRGDHRRVDFTEIYRAVPWPLFRASFGGLFSVRHFVCRLVLWMNREAPLNYVRFLNYAVERIFLRRVGGGYTFVHRMLAEYFDSFHRCFMNHAIRVTQDL